MVSEPNIPAIGSEVPEISRKELSDRLATGTLLIVDVLAPESYATGHIPDAVNLPLESMEGRARELLPDLAAEIVVYCGKFT
jgi:rhodanese-related sulfurtransferase